jgi:RimJ/RimL family protein N-acetyltransferase
MCHELTLEGDAFRLRPVALSDAAFIARLRSDTKERLRFVHRVDPNPVLQEVWLKEYFNRSGDYYWIVERKHDGRPEGTVSLYNLDQDGETAEWGRWVLHSGSLAAPESSLLVHSAAFDLLGLASVYCLTVSANSPVVSFHDSTGAKREALLKNHFSIDGQPFDAVRHRVMRDAFPLLKSRLGHLSALVAAKIRA